MRALESWRAMSRQRRTGWTIILISVGYFLYFFKVRLFGVGPEISRKEWLYFVAMIGGLILGTINVRMAEMRERNQKTLPLVGENRSAKK